MREKIKDIVASDDVKYAIGYEKGTYGFQAAPSFAFTPDDVDKFIFSPLCVHNLSVFLMLEEKLPLPRGAEDDKRKIALIVKGCDSRALVQIIEEKGLSRDKIVILGMPCKGVIDPKKAASKFPDIGEITDVEDQDKKFIISANGNKYESPKEDLVFDKCKSCEYHTPLEYDVLLGDKVEIAGKEDYEDVKALEEKSIDEKWDYWKDQFSKCIRCYACRQACPLCYCKECMVDQLKPQWVRRSVDVSENSAWNILRAYHLAGRCIGCGECERACPMEIPLTELNKKLEKDVKEMFDYTAGVDVDKKPLLAIFKPNDPENFIL